MYALHDGGLAISAVPPPQAVARSTDQLERRAVESTERGSLATEDRRDLMYSSAAAVLQLLETSAQGFAEMMAVMGQPDGAGQAAGPEADNGVGQRLDVYA